MGYYEFNDHFWSPHEACQQKSEIVNQEEKLSIIAKLQNWLRTLKHSKIASPEQHDELNLRQPTESQR